MRDNTPSGAITDDLRKWQLDGDAGAEERLFRRVEPELLAVARAVLRREWSDYSHRIDPCELVNEAYLALRTYPINTENRRPFFRLMARAMRNHLGDMADYLRASKRPPDRFRVSLSGSANNVQQPSEVDLIDYYDAIDALRREAPRQADAIELRVFGLTNEEIATTLDVGLSTVKRDVAEARAYIAFRLGLQADWISG
jgi:RNA polymerase sigma factor (TIGR02999 family)